MGWLANLRLKLLAIVVALGMWGGVAYAENPTVRQTYNLTIDRPNVPAGLVVTNTLPSVQVTVVGSSQEMHNFDPRSLSLTANFSGVHVGGNRVPISVTSSDPNATIELADTFVIAQVDQIGTVDVQVQIQRQHQLPSGFHEVSAGVTPTHVIIRGPQSQLSGVQAVVDVDLQDQVALIDHGFQVKALDPNGKTIDKAFSNPTTVNVRIDIQPDNITESKAAGAAITGQPAAGYIVRNIQVTPISVECTGLADVLAALEQVASDPVDVSNATADVVKTVALRPPAGVTVKPTAVQVHVFIAKNPQASPSPTPAVP